MSLDNRAAGGVELTPELLAYWFWEMDSEEQADFFAELDRISEHKLCLQMAYTVTEISARSARGDYASQNGFQTMLSHAQGYVEASIDHRHYMALYDLSRMATKAKEAISCNLPEN